MPKVTVYTPSHNPQYLDQCWQSLAAQSFTDFEWIVLLNGDAEWTPPDDHRIILPPKPKNQHGVGYLKMTCCDFASGEYLVELDHDDLLQNDALALIVAAFSTNPDTGLVYSDTAQINADGSENTDRFADGYGWTYYETDVKVADTIYHVSPYNAKPPIPHNVSYVWYAPNHVRAFRRTIYEQCGGYNPDLTVCDDIDLICRMYQLAPFAHIPYSIYLQRIHDDNTQKDPETNAFIQSETVRIYDENIQPNSLIWAQRNNLPCYDLGGAHNCPDGYEPIDMALSGIDVIDWLATQPDDSVGVYRAVDFLEHITDKITLFNELYRTLAPGGMLLSLTPSTDGRGAFCDPTHVSFYNELSFRYYCDTEYQKYVPAITSRFRQSRLFTYFPTPWHEEQNLSYVLSNLTKE